MELEQAAEDTANAPSWMHVDAAVPAAAAAAARAAPEAPPLPRQAMPEPAAGACASGASGSQQGPPASGTEAGPEPTKDDKPKRLLSLLPSVFEGRPPVLFFSYTVACGAKQRPMERAEQLGEDVPRLFYSHTDKVNEYNAVINILRQGGLYRVKADCQRWSLLWSKHPTQDVLSALRPLQRTNHFPGSWHLGRKDLIWRHISRFQKRFGKPFNITPQGFILPKNMASWEAARLRQPSALWIWKPCSQSCGRGIKVLSSALSPEENRDLGRKRGIIQRYVDKPLLLDGYKCDLRIYVVVLSYDPLKVYINDEGLVRMATEKYNPSLDTLSFTNMHLTNYSVNKLSPAFVQPQDGRGPPKEDPTKPKADGADGEEPRAFKWSLAQLRKHFDQRGLNYDAMFDSIKDLVIKTLIAVEPPMQAEWCTTLEQTEEGWAAQGASGCNRGSCFEMYGFDVIIDSAMKPWLLEINICPSLSSGSPLDKRIKTKLVADSMTLVGIRPPASVWQTGGTKRKADGVTAEACAETRGATPIAYTMSKVALDARAAAIAACKTAEEAVAMFEEAEWDLVMESHDEEMRSGGLERIFPCAKAAQYTPFMAEESYCNLVLRRWHEAGGAQLFEPGHGGKLLPAWLPKKVCFAKT